MIKILIKDIDLEVIKNIFNELPDYLNVSKITFDNGYQVHMVAGSEQIKDYDRDVALNEILFFIRENKNYLEK